MDFIGHRAVKHSLFIHLIDVSNMDSFHMSLNGVAVRNHLLRDYTAFLTVGAILLKIRYVLKSLKLPFRYQHYLAFINSAQRC